jgi:hypothetical protein
MLAGTVWLISFDRSSNAAPFQDVACLSRKSLDPANRRGQGHNNCHPARSRRRWSQLNGAKRHVDHRFALRVKTVTSSTRSITRVDASLLCREREPASFNKFLPKIWNHTAIRRAAPHPKRHAARGLMRQPAAS